MREKISVSGEYMLCALLLLMLPIFGTSDALIEEANANLLKGQKATSYEERKLALNRALYLFSLLEQNGMTPSFPLFRTLGDIYFQLGEYPWAILYYLKTLKWEPQDSLASAHLEMTQKNLGISTDSSLQVQQNTFMRILGWLSGNRIFVLLAILLTFITWSLFIWFPTHLIRNAAVTFSFILALLLAAGAVFYYSTPLEGILISSTGFYRAPGKDQPQLTEHPLFAGSKVNVLQSTTDGNWLKVSTGEGLMGYIPSSHFRLI